MNVYDWDKTIFPKDSTVEFYFYNLKKDIGLIRYAPKQIAGAILYFLKVIDKTTLKKYIYSYLKGVQNIDQKVEDFWDENIGKVNEWYKERHKSDDVVISASATFLIQPACRRLNISKLIASEVNQYTGEVLSKNCSSQQKVQRFIEEGYKTENIDEFYSDSFNDVYLARLAKKAYLVKKGKLTDWPNL